MTDALFNGWEPIARTALLTFLTYPCLLICLRVSGHRTLAKLNAFDFVVTVALGSTLSSIIISSDVSLAQGVLAVVMLVGLQYLVAKGTVKSKRIEYLVNGEPVLLYHSGSYLLGAMMKARITKDEIKSKVRVKGEGDMSNVTAVILETNGDLSVVTSITQGMKNDALEVVPGFKRPLTGKG